MAEEDSNEILVYAFVDEHGSTASLDANSYNQDENVEILFKTKVAELQELIQVMPEKQMLAVYDYWRKAQKYISSQFDNLLVTISLAKGNEHSVINRQTQGLENNLLPHTSGPCGAPNIDVPPINVQVDTLNVPEMYLKGTRLPAEGYKEKTMSLLGLDSGKCISSNGETTLWEVETLAAAKMISDSGFNNNIQTDTEVKQTSFKNTMPSLSNPLHRNSSLEINEENMSPPKEEKVVHIQVEKVDGKTDDNTTVNESLAIDEADTVIILQSEDVFDKYMVEENSKNNTSKKILNHREKIGCKEGKRGIKKTKKGRPKRKEFDEMCIPVVKEDGTKVFQCELCGVQMPHYPNLEVHLRSHTGQRPFQCSKCPKTFTTKGNMKEHEATHDKNRPQYKCEECGKLFKQFKCLKIHTRIHTGEKPYECNVCGKAFTQPGILQSHLLTHTDQKRHQCVTCGKCFRLSAHLELHMKRHENKRDFKCEECGFETITKGDLVRHMQTHSGEKRFSCMKCQKKFTRAHYLSEHMNIHDGKTPFHCTECDASFSLSTKLYSHKRKHRVELIEKLLKERQSKTFEKLSVTEAGLSNQSVRLKIADRHVEIHSANPSQTGILKLPEYAAKFVKYTENQSGFKENLHQTQRGIVVSNLSEKSVQTRCQKNKTAVPQMTENLWAGDEQYVELVIGQDISVEDLNSLITSKILSFSESEGTLIEANEEHVPMQE